MGQFYIIANQIAILGILVAIGFVVTKLKVIDESIRGGLAKLIVKVTMPLLIFTSLTNLDLTADMIRNGVMLLLWAYVSLLLLLFIGLLSSKFLGLKGKTRHVHTAYMMFGNIVFLGFPLFDALFPGGEGIFYAVLFHIANDTLLWTVGIYLLNKHHGVQKAESGIKHMINPNTVAFIVGVLMLLAGMKLPTTIHQSFAGLGSTTVYLSMVFIGATLAGIKLKGIYKKYSIFVLSALKMILIPLGVMFMVRLFDTLFGLGLNDIAKTVLVLQVAMPGMATVAVLAKDFESDYVYATEYVFVSTMLSLGTLPLVFYMMNVL